MNHETVKAMRPRKVVIVSRIFLPEPAAASFRLAALARGFAAEGARVVIAGRRGDVARTEAEALLLPKGNPKGFKSYADIAKDSAAKLGAPGGGTEEKLALDAGVPRDRLVVVPDPQSGLKMLEDGRLDAYSLPVLSLNDLLKKSGSTTLEVFAPVQGAPVYCDGAAFNKKDTALRDAFDVELAKMKESGDFAKIVEPYGFSAQAAISTNRETLCAQE